MQLNQLKTINLYYSNFNIANQVDYTSLPSYTNNRATTLIIAMLFKAIDSMHIWGGVAK